ncbi:hypothetical protein [Granulicella rosea]|uniref:hypothetical protein n=1 Tax=Granulicella rosea TaxID=474952 RepID=UPI00115E013A|nr:hypothetical protein [Granulicella rosea]
MTLSTSQMAPEVGGCLLAVATFSLVLFCPGYVFAWAFDFFEFRARSTAERVVWSVPLSLCVVTIAAVLVGKLLSVEVLCWLAGAFGLAFGGTVVREARGGGGETGLGRSGRWALAMLAGWTLFAIFELIDLPVGARLYMSSAVYDHALRTAFVDAVARTGVPPVNPLYWPGHASTMRYYYFWYVLCAVVVKLAGVSARSALIASCVWSGYGLASLIALFTRYFDDVPPARVRQRVLTGLALLTVTGFDLLPVLGSVAAGKSLADPEWWAQDQVTSWMDALLWAPHHMAAVIACLTGFLLIWVEGERRRWLVAVVAGAGFAGAFGLSTWVALGFAILMCGWLAWLLATGSRRRASLLLAAGAVAAVLLLPYLRELRGADQAAVATTAGSPAPATHLLGFGPRRILSSGILSSVPGFRSLRETHPYGEEQLAGIVLLAPGYVLELGFFGVVLVLGLRRWRILGEANRTGLALAIACLILTGLVRSTVIANNDFAMRVTLVAQFLLLLLAARMFGGWKGDARLAMLALAGFGVLGTVVQAVWLRGFLPFEESRQRAGYVDLAERNAAFHTAFNEMGQRVPRDAVIAYRPETLDFYNLVVTLNLGRQALNAIPECNTAFGGSAVPCAGIRKNLASIYDAVKLPGPEAQNLCRSMNADYLVATRWDAVWTRPGSWAWTLPPVVATDAVHIVSCGR